MTLVVVLAADEGRTDRYHWRSPCASIGRNLGYFGSLGYVRADVERGVR